MPAITRKRLSKEEIKEICKDIEEFKYNISGIAKKYDVNPNVIRNIANRTTYKNISKDFNFSKYNERDTKLKKPYTFVSKDVITAICEDLQNTDMSLLDIGSKYGVSDTNIRRIYHRKIHRDISKSYEFKERPAFKKGRGKETVSDDVCKKICIDISENKIPLTEIAEKYNVGLAVVRRIYTGKYKLNISKNYDFNKRIEEGKNYHIRLNNSKVSEICKDLQDTNMSLIDISLKHDVSIKTIRDIYHRKTHRNISENYKFKPESFYFYKRSTSNDESYNTSIDTIHNIWNSIVLGNSNREYIQMMKMMMVYGYRLGKSNINVDVPDDFYEL